jgi:hypothetical protein
MKVSTTGIDIKGQVFGLLLVERRAREVHKDGRIRWICTCECGNETIVASHDLRYGRTRSCGCLYQEAGRRTMLEVWRKRRLLKSSRGQPA